MRETLWRRWRFQQTRINKEAGLVFNDTEWAKEWDEIVGLASAEPRNNKNSARRRSMVMEKQSSLSCAETIDGNATYDSLEEIHVQALSYVLRRPIIVIADVVLRDVSGLPLAPINFGGTVNLSIWNFHTFVLKFYVFFLPGIFLPLDIPQEDCHKIPLLLAYGNKKISLTIFFNVCLRRNCF